MENKENTLIKLHRLVTKNGDKTIFESPLEIVVGEKLPTRKTLNIIMGDVSGSMSGDWQVICDHWNKYISNKLNGKTKYGITVNIY